MYKALRPAITLFLLITFLTGVIYPALVTLATQSLFPDKSQGSLVIKNGSVVGSRLIGQPFNDPKYFWSRPSATQPFSYNAAQSSGSNLSPANPALIEAIKKRTERLKAADPDKETLIPADLVTSSGSGLDPHISLASALYQLNRVAKARNIPPERAKEILDLHVENPLLGFIGEKRVNVLMLNMALDALPKEVGP